MDGDRNEETVRREESGIEQNDTQSVSDMLDYLCPYYMSIGMSYDEYWHGYAYAHLYYEKLYKIQQERLETERDYCAWLTGLYTYEAICDVSPILHDFAKKGTKPVPYSKEPLSFKLKREENKAQSEKQIENGRLAFRVQMDAWMKATAKHFANEKRGEENNE